MNLIQFRSKIAVKTLDNGWVDAMDVVMTHHDEAREVPQEKPYEFLRVEGAFNLLFVYVNKQHTVEKGETTNTSITAIMLELIAVM